MNYSKHTSGMIMKTSSGRRGTHNAIRPSGSVGNKKKNVEKRARAKTASGRIVINEGREVSKH